MTDKQIVDFIRESNCIEGIHREPTPEEIQVSVRFLALPVVGVENLRVFVAVCQPGAALREHAGLDVRVGNHVPPPGGPKIMRSLKLILERANVGDDGLVLAGGVLDAAFHHPYRVHQDYETLHPFTDGNGRSGRILWAWQMLRQKIWPGLQLGFLHAYYYQSLERGR